MRIRSATCADNYCLEEEGSLLSRSQLSALVLVSQSLESLTPSASVAARGQRLNWSYSPVLRSLSQEPENEQVRALIMNGQRLKRLNLAIYEDIPVCVWASYIESLSRLSR